MIDLGRFLRAQEDRGTYERALAELRAGRKRSHWMWFVFPQLQGLGHSELSRRYAIASLQEARAYLADPVLGARLRECATALLALEGASAQDVLGGVDALKLRSSMTLFARAAAAPEEEDLFERVLARYFAGAGDELTLRLLEGP
jgi:uncharacterized protein (DUF1810 family)